MNCVAVIEREMRTSSRKRWTFLVRALFAAFGAVVCLFFLAAPRLSPAERGRNMLMVLSCLSLGLCLFTGGFLTADSVSAEKREGTLGLLFLTPLNGLDIVLGKMACHSLQLFYGVVAMFPIFFLPIFNGGVTWGEVSRICLALSVALVFSASIGIFISVFATESRTTLTTTFVTVFLWTAVPMVLVIILQMLRVSRSLWFGPHLLSPVFTLLAAFDNAYRTTSGARSFWASLLGLSVLSLGRVVASGFLLPRAYAAMGRAGLRRSPAAKNELAPPRLPPDVSPYEWAVLRQAQVPAAFRILTLFLVTLHLIMCAASVLTSRYQACLITAMFSALALHVVTKIRLAIEATRQLHQDRQAGALELLLVTPLPEQSILDGHQRAIRSLSRKSWLLLVSLNLLMELMVLLCSDQLHISGNDSTAFSVLFIGGAVLAWGDIPALTALAPWHALRSPTHMRAALLTCLQLFIPPYLGIALVILLLSAQRAGNDAFVTYVILWVLSCLVYDRYLVHRSRARLQNQLRRLVAFGA
jgi:ABC-type transport system involved in multi-copper enzyme maturation permease subunit